MDELQFRRHAYSDPDDRSEGFLREIEHNEGHKAFVEELRQFDKKLGSAFAVDVPDDLADRLILAQTMESSPKPRFKSRPQWGQLALAASVAFLLGLGVQFFPGFSSGSGAPTIGQIALTHAHQEASFVHGVDEKLTLASVNSKLNRYGGKFSQMPAQKLLFVNHCNFYGGPGLHLVLQGEKGPVDVFVIPADRGLKPSTTFGDSKLRGLSYKTQTANVVIVGEIGENLQATEKELKTEMQWI
ncbi:DUF3379 family protein [Dongshaea marina]|uniref:DUF3379 family protein n=1 Tax=Dongshaea marina TaxID=2047966 RepID=UPI000D3EBF51|nr:DUF3379 family protein [Dongshaea marina]